MPKNSIENAKAALSPEVINERLADIGIKMTGPYVSSATKTTFEDKDGNQWEATPGELLAARRT